MHFLLNKASLKVTTIRYLLLLVGILFSMLERILTSTIGHLKVATFSDASISKKRIYVYMIAWNPLFFSDKDAMTDTFQVLVNTYLLNFRLALLWFCHCLLIILRVLVHLIE